MGAGNFPAGRGRAGFDPPQVIPSKPVAQYADAMQYSVGQRGFVYQNPATGDPVTVLPLSSGTNAVQGMDPVDQKVALLIGIEYGAIGSAPTQFSKMRQLLSRVPADKKPTIARQELNRLFAQLLSAGDIVITDVTVDTVGQGTDQVFFSYDNLRAGTSTSDMQVT